MNTGLTHTSQLTFTQADFNRFAALTGDDNPIHVDPAFAARTKFGKTVAHGMLLYSAILRGLGAMHGGSGIRQISQELMFPTPTYVQERLRLVLKTTAQPAPGAAEISTEILRPGGQIGCSGTAVVVRDGFDPQDIKLPAGAPDSPSAGQHGGADRHRGLRLGQTAEHTYTITLDDHQAYLALLQERNPLHTDQGYAQQQGLRDVLLTGGQLGGMISHLLGTRLPGPGTNWLKQRFRFLKPTHPGDPVTARIQVIRLRPEKDLVNLTTRLENPAGELLVNGQALVLVSDLERRTYAEN